MSDKEKSPQESTSDDRLWAALAYVLTPVLPAILLFVESKRDRPYIREHNAQALVWGIIFYVVVGFSSIFLIGLCLWPLGLLLNLYWGYRAYQGEAVNIPVISDFVRTQGWA